MFRKAITIPLIVLLCLLLGVTIFSGAACGTKAPSKIEWGPLFAPEPYSPAEGGKTALHSEDFRAFPGKGRIVAQATGQGLGSVQITLNGKQVISSDNFGKQAKMETDVDLLYKNAFSVQLQGDAASKLNVTITQLSYADPYLPKLEICSGPEWNVERKGTEAIIYSPKELCKGDWRGCVYTLEDEKDKAGRPLQHLAVVVDGMAATIRWSPVNDKATAIMPSVLTAADYVLGPATEQWRELEDYGVRIIEYKFEKALTHADWPGIIGRMPLAFLSPKSDPVDGEWTLREMFSRHAAIIKWAHDNLSDGRFYATIGCSGACVATLATMYWYHDELDPIVDFQYASGCAVMWDACLWCGCNPQPGICANDPSKQCSTDAECGPTARCGTGTWPPVGSDNPFESGRRYWDLVLGWGGTCAKGECNQAYRRDSLRYTPGSYDFHHLVVMAVNDDKNAQFEDTNATSIFQGGQFYQRMTGPKQWLNYDGYQHCDDFNAQLWPTTKPIVLKGMGLQP